MNMRKIILFGFGNEYLKKMKPILILLALALSAYAEENPYESIAERNAFNLTDKKPAPTLPPVKKILAPSVFLTGITRIDGIKKVHFVLRKAGDQDKFISCLLYTSDAADE